MSIKEMGLSKLNLANNMNKLGIYSSQNLLGKALLADTYVSSFETLEPSRPPDPRSREIMHVRCLKLLSVAAGCGDNRKQTRNVFHGILFHVCRSVSRL